MWLVLSEAVERAVLGALPEAPPRLRSWCQPGEDLVHLGPSERPPGTREVAITVAREVPTLPLTPQRFPGVYRGEPGLILVPQQPPSGEATLSALYATTPYEPPQPCHVEVVRLSTDLFLRLQGIYDSPLLAARTVGIIGLGSGGSLVAVELGKAGVGRFLLVDFDRVRVHNVSRHACGLRDVGRYKTRAVRDLLLDRNPSASVDCYEADVTQNSDLLVEVINRSDLLVVATDTELSKYLINEACLIAGKPAVYAGAYSRAFAGEVARIVPGETGCYACVRHTLVDTMRALAEDTAPDYTAADEPLRGEPGLGLDVGMIAFVQARMALLTLLRGTNTLEDLDADIVLWVNRARPEEGRVFSRPLWRYFARIRPQEDCPVCGASAEPLHV